LGERINIPEFGGGIRRLIFESASANTAAMTKSNLTRAINRWLGHRLKLEKLEVAFQDNTIEIFVQYTLVGTGESRALKFKKNDIN
jgi:phage baseplate assembly protein W